MRRNTLFDSIAILDLDGEKMIINTSARDREAHRRVQIKIRGMTNPPAPDTNEYRKLFYNTDTFYDSGLLALDQLNPGVDLALARLQELYTDLYILTSRPDFLAAPTEEWLSAHDLLFSREAIRYKFYADGEEQREQRVSTAAWKAIIVHQAAIYYKQVLFVDDDEKNRQAVTIRKLPNVLVKNSLADYSFDEIPIFL